jgi:hypothetical protein
MPHQTGIERNASLKKDTNASKHSLGRDAVCPAVVLSGEEGPIVLARVYIGVTRGSVKVVRLKKAGDSLDGCVATLNG